MKKASLLIALLVTGICVSAAQTNPSDIDGTWLGTLNAGGQKLRLLFRFTTTPEGLKATMTSIDQIPQELPASSVTRDSASLKVELRSLGVTFEGRIDRDRIEGVLTQGSPFPLVLERVKDSSLLAPPRRPQNPSKPYPYREEEIAFENKSAGITLAATLTLPEGRGPFAAAVLITGSGPEDRDETVFGHKPFLVLADYLTRKGIAILRADDRGVGKSGGKFSTAVTADFAGDAEAGVAYLKTRADVNARRIGLIGHSEGGSVAPMVAARNPDIAFIVLMAGPGVPGDEIIVSQVAALSEAAGASHQQAEEAAALQREILALVKQEKDNSELLAKMKAKFVDNPALVAKLTQDLPKLSSPWYRSFLAYDPATSLREVRCPVLAVNGEKDLQVPAKQNLQAIDKALKEAGNKQVEIAELPGLNHLFQTAKTGAIGEYAQIEETISPIALERIANWLLKHIAP